MRRVHVVGTSGSGKSTLARALAERLGVPVVELDASWHQPDWTSPETDSFRSVIHALAAEDGWVIDGDYSAVHDIVWSRADTVVWLDLPRIQTMVQVFGRSLRRVVTSTRLWHGNRERLSMLADRDREENILLWAWTTYSPNVERYARLMTDPVWPHLTWMRLQSRMEVEEFLQSVT